MNRVVRSGGRVGGGPRATVPVVVVVVVVVLLVLLVLLVCASRVLPCARDAHGLRCGVIRISVLPYYTFGFFSLEQ